VWPSVPGHHGEPADPVLLEWIEHRIGELVSLGPLAFVVLLGVVIVALPAALVGLYLVVRRRAG
jgi:hypothetical protein